MSAGNGSDEVELRGFDEGYKQALKDVEEALNNVKSSYKRVSS